MTSLPLRRLGGLTALCGLMTGVFTGIFVGSAGSARASSTDWTAQLTITSQDPAAGPQQLILGTSATGSDGYVGNEDFAAPPAPPAGTSALSMGVFHTTADIFPLNGTYVRDIRAPVPGSQTKTWKPINAFSAIDITNGNRLTINWSLSGVPDNIQLQFQEIDAQGNLTDINGDGVTSYDMKQVASYSYTQDPTTPSQVRQFQVVATNTSPAVKLVGSVAQSGLNPNGVTLQLTTDRPAGVEVNVTPANGGTTRTFTQPDLTTQHSIVLAGLDPNTSYTALLTATATDTGIEPLVVNGITFQTPTTPINIANISVTPTSTDATITFTTDVAANTVVDYGTTAMYGQSVSDTTLTQTHSIKLAGLTPNTNYHFRITEAIPGQGQAQTGDRTFTTLALAVNITQAPKATNVSSSGATIVWTTDVASDSLVEYGTSTNYDKKVSLPDLVTNHSVPLTNLNPNTLYHFRVTSAAMDRPSGVSADATFQTPTGKIQFVFGPTLTGKTGSSATIAYDTNVPTDTLVKYGPGNSLTLVQQGPDNTTHHVVTLTGLQPQTQYSFQVVSSAAGFDSLSSPVSPFITLSQNQNFSFVDSYSVLDVANDPTGQIQDQTSPLFGATTGAERGIAYDAKRGIVYIARGTLTTEDGRSTGQFGVAAIKLTPPQKSFNPNVPDAVSNYTDTGLITSLSDEQGLPGLGFVQSVAYDPVSDQLFVFSGAPGGGPSKTPRVYVAPGGTLGGAPNGGDPSRPNPALSLLFNVTEPIDSSGVPLGGNNRGIAVRTVGNVTTVYLAMAQHADVWNNDGGSWHRIWSSNLFPADTSASTPLRLTDAAIRSVTVDDAGNSYWAVGAANTAPRIWVFPPTTAGTGVGFNDAAFGGTQAGPARPLLIDNDGTLIPPANFSFPANIAFEREGANPTLWVSLLGSDSKTPSIARLRLTSDPNAAGNAVTARLSDAFGAGATGAVQDPILASLAVKGSAGQTQPAEPPVSGKLLYFVVSPEENALYLNGFIKNTQAGQSIPTSAVVKVSYGALMPRPFFTKQPQVTVKATTATVTWSTDLATTDNRIVYGPTTSYGFFQAEPPVDGGSQDHSVTLTNLQPGTTYHFRVLAGGTGLESTVTADATFTTSSNIVAGDLTNDGVVDIKDATLSLQLGVGVITPTAYQKQAGDVNGDGVLDLKDTTIILRKAVGLG